MSEDDVSHRRKISIEQTHNLFGRSVFGDTRKAANVGKQNRDRLTHTPELERVRILEHLLHYVLRQKPAVVRACNFFSRQTLVSTCIFNCNRGLCRDRTNQLEIVRLECGKRIESIGVQSSVNTRLRN